MYGILLSAGYSLLGFLARSVIAKFFLFFGLWYVTTEFSAVLIDYLPGADILNSAFASQTPGVWFFLDLFQVSEGISACLAAFVLRFAIRRLPIIG